MSKLRLVLAFTLPLALVVGVGFAALAEPVPPPYAGLKNPFPWDDATTQQAGKKLYQQSCLGCHGIKGDTLAVSNFSASSYADDLQDKPDLYLWELSEGRLDKGMPPFKSSLSDTQRWQLLTYVWALGRQPAPATAPAPRPVPDGAVLAISLPNDAKSGQPVTLTASLQDNQAKPIDNASVKFFMNASFFTRGLMEIGDATTDKTGIATLNTFLPEPGDVQIVARHESLEATTTLHLTPSNRPFYRTTVGIRMPSFGQEVFVGPVVSEGIGQMGQAPGTTLRLPGGTLSWLLLPVAAVLLIWSTYFYVVYQVLHISPSGKAGASTRTVPYALLLALAIIGLSLALKVATGPYSQFHLFP